MRIQVKCALVGLLFLLTDLCVAAPPPPQGKTQPPADGAFPTQGLLPKQETGAASLLQQNPEFDGRGVVVAVFDTGVDPGAEGLRTTPDGRPKIVDVVDASGSGDVDTTTIRQAKNHQLEALSGRSLRVPEDLSNPTGNYHLGIKSAYELYPKSLLPRLKAKRLEKWLPRQRAAVGRLRQQIADWDADHPRPTASEKVFRQELANRLEVLGGMQDAYQDPGPLFDCVVFHDGQNWRAMIDTDEDGDLRDEKQLTDYHRERQYATFGSEDLLNYCVNIYDKGRLLSIVVDSGDHGTHVAGIIAGYYPNQPELNGIAPGAQIVSVKIGDTRVGTRSLGTGSVRGLVATLRNKCDLINMSYGGATPEPDRGRITKLYQEIVDRHGVIFVASAGNSGPGLTTAGSPGGTTSAILGVGASLSPALMQSAYSMRETRPEELYTWSSRGPAADGDLGVDIAAPGGAFAPVPRWSLQRNMLKNGTSMSSPNACGGIALLLSALKARKQYYTPDGVRTALRNTARPLEGCDPFSQGRGMLQVDRALEYLERFPVSKRAPLRYDVRLDDLETNRGIYLREPYETRRPLKTNVTITPIFREQGPNSDRVQFNQRVALRCDAAWVQSPEFVLLSHGGRSFSITVDPTNLSEGAHYAELLGFDAEHSERGPIFRLPITVIRPERLERPSVDDASDWQARLTFQPGQIERRFIAVPSGATWADLTLRAGANETSRTLVYHAVQLLPQVEFTETSHREYVTLPPGDTQVRSFPVTGGRTLELCLAQYWTSLGEGHFDIELTFHGLKPNAHQLQIDGGQPATRVDVRATIRDEHLDAKVRLTTLRQGLQPTASVLRPLDPARDLLTEQRRVHELVLTYDFELTRDTTLTPRAAVGLFPQSGMELESGLWMIFDEGKQFKAAGSSDESIKLSKGKYVLRFQWRHDDARVLERLQQSTLLLDEKLTPALELSIHDSGVEAFRGGGKSKSRALRHGDRAALFVASLDAKKLPPAARPGDLLLGEITFGKQDEKLVGEGRRPGGFPVVYWIAGAATDKQAAAPGSKASSLKGPGSKTPDSKEAEDAAAASSDSKKRPWSEQLAERLRAAKLAELAVLRKQGPPEAFEELAEQLKQELDDDLPVLLEQIKRLDDGDRKPHLPEIVQLADQIIGLIDRDELARQLSLRVADDDEAAKKKRAEFERQKATLLDALYRKGRALAYMDLPPKFGVPIPEQNPVRRAPESKSKRNQLFEQNFAELARWADPADEPFVLLHIRRERRHNRRGTALKLLNEHIQAHPHDKMLYSKRVDLLHELKWSHWRDNEMQWMRLRFPAAYPPF